MRIVAALQGDFAAYLRQETLAAETAVTAGVKQTTDALKLSLRRQVTSAGLGTKLANTWRGEVYPRGQKSLEAAGFVWSKSAADMASGIEGAITSAFSDAENAVAEFVKTGKLDVSDFVTSILADLARLSVRQTILGPLAKALSSVLTSSFGSVGGDSAAGATVDAVNPLHRQHGDRRRHLHRRQHPSHRAACDRRLRVRRAGALRHRSAANDARDRAHRRDQVHSVD